MSDVKPVLVYVVDQLFEFSDKSLNYPFASTLGHTRLGGKEDMSLILDASRVECLISFVDHCVQRDGCLTTLPSVHARMVSPSSR